MEDGLDYIGREKERHSRLGAKYKYKNEGGTCEDSEENLTITRGTRKFPLLSHST